MSADLKCVVSNAAPVVSISSAQRIAETVAKDHAHEVALVVTDMVIEAMRDIFGTTRVVAEPPQPVVPPPPQPLNPDAIRCLSLEELGIATQWLYDLETANVTMRLPSGVPGLPRRLQGAVVKAGRLVSFAHNVARAETRHVRLMRNEVHTLNALETCTWNDPKRAYHRQRLQALGAEIAHTLRDREAYRTAILEATLLET